MNALIPFATGSLPPARAALLDLTAKIERAERQLATLQSGKAALAAELGRAAGAKAELQALVDADALTLVDRLKSGGQWLLSNFGNARARELSASLAESRIQAAVGEKALDAVALETAALEHEIGTLQAPKPQLIAQTMREAAAGLFEDYADAVDQLRDLMTQLRGLEVALGVERIPARTAATLPDFNWQDGLPEMAIVAPAASIAASREVWAGFATRLGDNPLASVDELKFQTADPKGEGEMIEYDRMTAPERRRVDMRNSQGAN